MAQQYTEDRTDDGRGSRGRRRGGRGLSGWEGSGRGHPHLLGHRGHHDRGGRSERPELRSGSAGALRTTVASLIAASRQVVMIGDEAEQQSARVLVDNAVRGIYSILANGPTPGPVAAGRDGSEADADAVPGGGA